MRVCGRKTRNTTTARLIHHHAALIVAALIWFVAASHAQTTVARSRRINQSDPTIASGQRTFEGRCAGCHGLNGKGGERGPDIATKPEIIRLSDNEILKILRDGKLQAGMPSFAKLEPAKLSDVVSYLRLLQGKSKSHTATAGAEEGRNIFTGKAGCSDCHMVRGKGGFLGPDLTDYGESHGADDIRSAIVNANKSPSLGKGLARATTKDGNHISGLVKNEDNFSVQLLALDGTFHLLEKSNLSELKFDSAPLMPNDYDSWLSQSELDQLVAYLLSVKDAKR